MAPQQRAYFQRSLWCCYLVILSWHKILSWAIWVRPDSDLVVLVFSMKLAGVSPVPAMATDVVNPLDNMITAMVNQFGFFYISERDTTEDIFSNGFEG